MAALPELDEVLALAAQAAPWARLETLTDIPLGAAGTLPVPALTLGSTDPAAPLVIFVGGVHGLERIGSQVVIAYLRSLVMRLGWDEGLHRQLEQLRLLVLPVVNPGGMWLGTRANPAGVDLMRSAPVEAREGATPLVGGHRLSPRLPWYRGPSGAAPEPECRALCEVVEREIAGRPFALALDCHSGFGQTDRLWFPWASRRQPMPDLAEVHALGGILDASLLHHRYQLEPQCHQYLTHGDLWDHLYSRSLERGGTLFLPLTLEMGSWLWVRKRPSQLLSRHGLFNPGEAHRHHRVLRRHLSGLDFMARAAASWQRWVPCGAVRQQHEDAALRRWFAR